MTRRPAPRPWPASLRSAVLLLTLVAATFVSACSRFNRPSEDDDAANEPISIQVKNNNFLDVNVYIVSNGMSRRLGFVSGNNSGTFSIPFSVARSGGVVLTATPVGGSGQARSPSLNVSPGQVIEFIVAANLRQSAAAVHDP
jgi:hypothetical protein